MPMPQPSARREAAPAADPRPASESRRDHLRHDARRPHVRNAPYPKVLRTGIPTRTRQPSRNAWTDWTDWTDWIECADWTDSTDWTASVPLASEAKLPKQRLVCAPRSKPQPHIGQSGRGPCPRSSIYPQPRRAGTTSPSGMSKWVPPYDTEGARTARAVTPLSRRCKRDACGPVLRARTGRWLSETEGPQEKIFEN